MKVLIISVYPPDPAPEANHALHISEQLAKLGHTVHVLCKKGSIASPHPGIVIHPDISDWSWSDLPRIVACLRDCRPDVVLLVYIGWVYGYHPMITFMPTICKVMRPGVPCVTQFEIIDLGGPTRSLRTRVSRKAMTFWTGRKEVDWQFGTLLRDSAQTIVLSSPHRDRLSRHHADVKEKTVILPPPPLIRVCQESPQTVRKRVRSLIGAADDDFVLIYWGYIYPGKGVETLLRAFRLICGRDRNVRLVLVGGKLEITEKRQNCADYFEMVRKLPEELGIDDRVTWTGSFNWDDDSGSQYLHGGDVCVLPFDYGVTLNNSSLAAASTHSLPVISTELAKGQDEGLEHGQNIYLCRPRNSELLAEAIQLVRDDANLRDRLKKGALTLARDWYTWETASKRLVGVLESAVSSFHAAGSDITTSPSIEPSLKPTKESHSITQWSQNGEGRHSGEQSDPLVLALPGLSEKGTVDDVTSPLVSVVVAVHNVDRYLSQCLDALVNQTLRDVEIIVVNDASSDRSTGIINDYKSSYPSLKVITCASNMGLASVRNIGLKAATGQYVAFADGDDWVDVKMCEVLYRHARENHAEVVIADATVFYEDTKKFGQFFDQHIRQTLDEQLRAMTFGLNSDLRVLLLEPVAWTKLYEREFLQKHTIQFEDGMNSYEDICFHFSVLLKAKRISLLNDRLFFYRQNRPGQISGRTSRKIFEVFDVFKRIHENLTAWNVDANIWAMLVKVQLRQFDWLMRDRVQVHHKREFLALVARQFQMIPEAGFRSFARQATPDELSKLFCMRRNWLYAYKQVVRQRWPLIPRLNVLLRERWRVILKRGWGILRRRVISSVRSLVNKSFNFEGFENTFRTVNDRLNQFTTSQEVALQHGDPLVETCQINNQILFLSRPANSGLGDAIWRMQNDYYLSQTAVLREGDTVIDVGAHLGVVSIYLAKKFPFIKVYAIEPNPLSYACLMRNIELNGVTNVTAIHKAVSEDGRKRILYTNAWANGWATIDPKMASSHHVLSTVQVETVTLEQLFQEYQISHCRLLKITAPGAIHGSLNEFTRSGCVDLLCGEVEPGDCSRVQLEMASWRIARQHFWRTVARQANGTVRSWLHQIPTGIEQPQDRIVRILTQREHTPIEP